jgi:SAM-dependent MidA family methyltransferase
MPDRFRPWRVAWTEALYGERGFYRRTEGPRGHFETSANAAGGVTELLAEALAGLARRHGCDAVVDVGAGRGELLTAMAAHSGELMQSGELSLTGVDVVGRPAGLPDAVRWLESPGGDVLPAELDGLATTLVIAHEWLDVVPCDVLERDDQGRLRLVEVDDSGQERLGPPASAGQEEWCARWWPGGSRVEVGLARDAAWAGLVSRVSSGVVVAVDYGHERRSRPPRGSLAAHRSGHAVPPVPDGSCDVTAEVAWDSLVAAAHDPRHPEPELVSQRTALSGLGVDAARPVVGADTAAYLRGLQRSGAAATLLDPGGLGGLTWLIRPVVRPVAIGQPERAPARLEP